jgi:hypothetical protein
MVTAMDARCREIIVALEIEGVLVNFEHVLARHRFSPEQQAAVALQVWEIEWPAPGRPITRH